MWFHASTKIVERWLHRASYFKTNSRKQCFHVSRKGILYRKIQVMGGKVAQNSLWRKCVAARLAQGGPDRLGWALPRWEAGGSGQSSSFVHRLETNSSKVCLHSLCFLPPHVLGSRVFACMSLNNMPLILFLTFSYLKLCTDFPPTLNLKSQPPNSYTEFCLAMYSGYIHYCVDVILIHWDV